MTPTEPEEPTREGEDEGEQQEPQGDEGHSSEGMEDESGTE